MNYFMNHTNRIRTHRFRCCLAHELNLLPEAVTEARIMEDDATPLPPHRPYTNEFKALLDHGVDLCEPLSTTASYLRSLIDSVGNIGKERDNNFYTQRDILNMLLANGDCPQTYKAVNEYLDYVNAKIKSLVTTPGGDPKAVDRSIRLAGDIRSAFEEYLKKKNLTPGILQQVKGQVKKAGQAIRGVKEMMISST